jgi:ribosomal protein S27AE/cell division protein FtsB
MKSITMKCANCGAGLQVASDMDHFACSYCGASLSVARQGGTVALNLVADSIAKVQVGTDRTAAELALVRLPKEIEERHRELDAMEERIHSLEAEINKASLPPTGSRKSSLIANHALRAIGFGIAQGLFLGFIVNWFFQAWLPASVGVYVGLFVAVVHAIKYFSDPARENTRIGAWIEDSNDNRTRQNAPFNAEELQKLRPARNALKDRLQKLNGQLAQASVMVDS